MGKMAHLTREVQEGGGNMAVNFDNILPPTGIINYADLLKYLGTSDQTLIERLKENKIPILKLGEFRRMWLIRLEDLNGGVME